MHVLRAAVVLAWLGRVATAQHLTPDDLARKSDESHVTGSPLAAYSIDFGFGGGARAYYYWNGFRDDARFATTPYLHRVFMQAFASTGGVQFHWLDWDAPRLADSPYRPRAHLVYARNTASNYFGGTRTLRFPGSPQTFTEYSDYGDARELDRGGITYTRYDQIDVSRPSFDGSIERSLAGNTIRLLAGIGIAYGSVHDYSGERVRAVDASGAETTAIEAPTRFREDCDAGRLVGCTGGRDHYVRIGFAYDTRDFEPDPNSGIFADAEIDIATVALGSEFDYVRGLAAIRGYYSPIPDRADLVLAGRVLAVAQSSGTPVFTLDILPFTEDPRFGLGGHRTMRGYRQDRFVDNIMSTASGEIRWTFARTTLWHQRLAFIVAPFVDVGRAFDDIGALTLRGWKPSTGAALRTSWNLATLVTFDYGVSAEDTGFYVNFGHMF